ncbi:MAG: hypothetical protein WCN92_02950 [Eubacteriales bacterium]
MYISAIKDCENSLKTAILNQCKDKNDPYYGGVINISEHVYDYMYTPSLVTNAVLLYLNEKSIYYKKKELFESIDMAMIFSNRWLNPDGTMHLLGCNFFTAAGSQAIEFGQMILIIDEYDTDGELAGYREQFLSLLEKYAQGILVSGFHTPNHRWIYASALSIVYYITKKDEFKNGIDMYLLEGIDCNADGEYAERSAGGYNVVSNNALIMIAQYYGKTELYQLVERNLKMMVSYIEPNMSLFTMNSTRQDKNANVWADVYFGNYLYMSKVLDNKEFYDLAIRILENAGEQGRKVGISLAFLMLNKELQVVKIPERIEKFERSIDAFYEKSGIVRLIENDISYSLLKDQTTFFYSHFGEISVYCRGYAHFFGSRNFSMQSIDKTAEGYQLHYQYDGKYLLPLKEEPETHDWWQMDHSKRETKISTTFDLWVHFKKLTDGVEIAFKVKTCKGVPIKFEFGISPNCGLEGENFRIAPQKGIQVMAKGFVKAENSKTAILIGPLSADNTKSDFMGGAVGFSNEQMTILMTMNCEENDTRTLTIRKIK